jgi:DNA-binding NarL/FixJ family response regulator
MLPILVADDHSVVREGIKRILWRALPEVDIGEAASGPEVLRRLNECCWRLLLLDLSLPGRHGLEIIPEIRRVAPAMPILVFSMYPEDAFGLRLFKLGAAGYLPKESLPNELVTAIHKVLEGGRYLSPRLAEHLAVTIDTTRDAPLHERLSDREFQVLRLIALGGTPTSIGQQLGLSDSTITTFRRNILRKLGLHANDELVRYAITHQLVAPTEAEHPSGARLG